MSEYQYYEFAASDGPISDEGLRYARGCSSRAEVSPLRWRNVYHFGAFHGSVDILLKHYDAHFYIANWGTVRLGLALPKGCLKPEAIAPYLHGGRRYEDTLTTQQVGERTVVWWERTEEGGWGRTEGEGLIDQLIGIREELMRGDYRALFLGWLADFAPDEWRDPKDSGVLMPPIPAALEALSPTLRTLIEHFPVDRDALAVAAGQSQATAADRLPIAKVLEGIPVSEMRALLARVAEGDGSRVRAELNRLTYSRAETPAGPPMSCTDFAAKAFAAREARLQREAKVAAEKRERDDEARKRHLASVRQRADSIWASLDALMEEKTASAYDQAAAQLQELRGAHEQAGENATFQEKLTAFRERYARRPAMMRRIGKL